MSAPTEIETEIEGLEKRAARLTILILTRDYSPEGLARLQGKCQAYAHSARIMRAALARDAIKD